MPIRPNPIGTREKKKKNFQSVSRYAIVERSPGDAARKSRRFFFFHRLLAQYRRKKNCSTPPACNNIVQRMIIYTEIPYSQWTWSISRLLTVGGTPLDAMQRYAPISDRVTFDKTNDSPSTAVSVTNKNNNVPESILSRQQAHNNR